MSSTAAQSAVPPPLIAVAGWLLPGLGYWLLGQKNRAITVGVTVLLTFIGGVYIAGIRVMDVPGYDSLGRRVLLATPGGPQWALVARPVAEVLNKPWFIGQIMAGPISIIGSYASLEAASPRPDNPRQEGVAASHGRLAEIGTLYTAVAGMLNLLAIIDSSYRAGRREQP